MERWKTSQLNYLSTTADLDTAYRISLNFAKNIGFKFFGFSTSYTSNTERLSALRLNNYPSDWNADYEQRKLAGIDPVVAHCNQSELPILWSEELFANAPISGTPLNKKDFNTAGHKPFTTTKAVCSAF